MMLTAAAGAAGRSASPFPTRMRTLALALLMAALGFSSVVRAEIPITEPTKPDVPAPQEDPNNPSLASDIKAYFTAPLRWDAGDWAWFGGSLLAIGAAHHYDTQVRTHFVEKEGPKVGSNSEDWQDALPTVAVIGATWLYAGFSDSSAGRREVWEMLEAGGLSIVPTYVLKFAAGRESPYQTSDPNEWFKGGKSFPSEHTSVAFAVGTVLAESGNDEYRWLRRLLGYGLGAYTGYERLKHNAHWLSDTVAGGAIGMASAHFVLNRHSGTGQDSHLAVVPINGGAMLVYRRTFN
jgi:membrane-associated phospholipid phosphatase